MSSLSELKRTDIVTGASARVVSAYVNIVIKTQYNFGCYQRQQYITGESRRDFTTIRQESIVKAFHNHERLAAGRLTMKYTLACLIRTIIRTILSTDYGVVLLLFVYVRR